MTRISWSFIVIAFPHPHLRKRSILLVHVFFKLPFGVVCIMLRVNTCIHLCNHHHNQDREQHHHPQKLLPALLASYPSLPQSILHCNRISYEWNCAVGKLSRLASLSQRNAHEYVFQPPREHVENNIVKRLLFCWGWVEREKTAWTWWRMVRSKNRKWGPGDGP